MMCQPLLLITYSIGNDLLLCISMHSLRSIIWSGDFPRIETNSSLFSSKICISYSNARLAVQNKWRILTSW